MKTRSIAIKIRAFVAWHRVAAQRHIARGMQHISRSNINYLEISQAHHRSCVNIAGSGLAVASRACARHWRSNRAAARLAVNIAHHIKHARRQHKTAKYRGAQPQAIK